MHLNLHSPKGQRLLLLSFLLLHTIASYYYIAHQNITYDEPQYIEYAKRWLHGHPERTELMDDSKSPVVAVCWLPRIVRQVINPHYQLHDYGRKDQEEGRHMMILFSLLAALYVYWWCKDLYGNTGWWLPLLLLLFDPLYLAYSTLITTDLACATFLVATLYHFRKYLLSRERKQFYFAAAYTGVAIVTKQNMLLVVVLLPLLSCIWHLQSRRKWAIKRSLIDVALFAIIALFVINLFYYFHRTFIPFGNYTFESRLFNTLQHKLALLHRLPIPLPEAYVQSIDMMAAHSETGSGKPGSTYNGVYLFGKINDEGGYWYYYLVTLFYKIPLGTMLLMAACMVLFIKKFRTQSFVRTYVFLLLPVIFYWVILSFFNKFQIGVRHMLLVLPLLFTGLGKLFYELLKSKLQYKLAAGLAIFYMFITVARYYPYIIPYTNEFVADKKMVYKKILDSSIDYGQADNSADDFIKTHAGYKKQSATPDTGKFIIPMDHILHSYLRENNPFKWYQKLQPEGLHKYVLLLYNVREADLVKAGLRK